MPYIGLDGVDGIKPLTPFTYDVHSFMPNIPNDIKAIKIIEHLLTNNLYALARVAFNNSGSEYVQHVPFIKQGEMTYISLHGVYLQVTGMLETLDTITIHILVTSFNSYYETTKRSKQP